MKQVTLSADLVQSVLNYLADRPYRESAPLIGAILQETNKSDDSAAVKDRADAERR